ncbi:MAG: DUF6263 family protein [Pirellulales bacterium]
MSFIRVILCSLCLLAATISPADESATTNDAAAQPNAATAKHRLRYKFHPDEVIRTKVTHQAAVKTTIEGTTQKAETVSISLKNWRVTKIDEDGFVTFVHSVEYVDMKTDLTGRETLRFDSRKNEEPPPSYQDVAKRVGIPLTRIVMDDTGKIFKREELAPGLVVPSQLTMPLPPDPVKVGDDWTFPDTLRIKLRNGEIKSVKMRQRFELKSVEDGVAEIHVETQILSPIKDNKELESQLIQRQTEGNIRFDIEAGRVLGQQIDLDRRLVGYPNDKSSMHYRTRFTEVLLESTDRTAANPTGPTAKKQ